MHIEEYLRAYISQDNNETDLSVIYSRPMRARGYRQRHFFPIKPAKRLPAGDFFLRPDLRATDSCRANLDSAAQKVANSLIRTASSGDVLASDSRRESEDEHRAPVAVRPVCGTMASRRERALYTTRYLPARTRACARTRAMLLAE